MCLGKNTEKKAYFFDNTEIKNTRAKKIRNNY